MYPSSCCCCPRHSMAWLSCRGPCYGAPLHTAQPLTKVGQEVRPIGRVVRQRGGALRLCIRDWLLRLRQLLLLCRLLLLPQRWLLQLLLRWRRLLRARGAQRLA